MTPASVAVWLNQKEICFALITETGKVCSLRVFPLVKGASVTFVVETITATVRYFRKTAPDLKILPSNVGVSISGNVDPTNGTLTQAPDELYGLLAYPLRDILQNILDEPVIVIRDMHAMAVCEATLGSGKNTSNFFYAMIEDSIDGALWHEGHLWQGTHGGAGQFAHLVADWLGEKPITLAQRASAHGIIAQYTMRSRKFDKPTVEEIISFSALNDQLAMRVLRDGGRIFGAIVAPLMGVLEPDSLVLNGKLPQNALWWESFELSFRQSHSPYSRQIELLLAQVQEHPALIGAGLLAIKM